MKKRKSFPRPKSKVDFKRKAGVHPRNYSGSGSVMRGGIRL